jgi:hypothetical protein
MLFLEIAYVFSRAQCYISIDTQKNQLIDKIMMDNP